MIELEWRDFTSDEVACYKLWYEFLKLTNKNDWSDVVSELFVDTSLVFEDWWPDHNYLFYKPKYTIIDEVLTIEEFKSYEDARPSEDDPGIVVLAVWMYKTKKEIREAFDEILARYHQGELGRPDFDQDGEYFSFANRPNKDFLEKILLVYKLFNQNRRGANNKRMTFWEIEEEVSKTKPLILKEGKKAEYIWTTEDIDNTILERRKRSQSKTVRKYLNYAKNILTHVVKGEFPVYELNKVQNKFSTPRVTISK